MDEMRGSVIPKKIAKRMALFSFLIVLCGVCLYARQDAPAFGFVLQYGYSGDSLDTWKGVFIRDAFALGHASSVDLRLTDEELREIRERLQAIDFWNPTKFPSEFKTPRIPGTGPFISVHPYETFSFTVTDYSMTKKLNWNDDTDVTSGSFRPAVELRAVFHRIRDMVEAKPEFKRLGPRTVFPR